MTTVCNDDCICVNCDCLGFYHPIESLHDRKIIRTLYNNLNNPIKVEPNPDTRKKNCRNGKLCLNSNCGFRHRLAFSSRRQLSEAYDQFKMNSTKEKKVVAQPVVKSFSIKTSNKFGSLDVVETTPDVVINHLDVEFPELPKKVIVVIETPKATSWADMADDDEFLMKF